MPEPVPFYPPARKTVRRKAARSMRTDPGQKVSESFVHAGASAAPPRILRARNPRRHCDCPGVEGRDAGSRALHESADAFERRILLAHRFPLPQRRAVDGAIIRAFRRPFAISCVFRGKSSFPFALHIPHFNKITRILPRSARLDMRRPRVSGR